MEKFNLLWISEVLLVFGSVTLGVYFAGSNVAFYSFVIGLVAIVSSIVLKEKAGVYN